MRYLKLWESFLIKNRVSEEIEKQYSLPSGILSTRWLFPLGLSESEVWNICDSVMTNPELDNQENYKTLKLLADDLTYDFFPYKGIEELPENTKFDILAGMSSGYNFDDIVWFSIDKKTFEHPDSKSVRDCMMLEFGIDVGLGWKELKPGNKKMQPSIGWVPSQSTLDKLREMKGKF